eukprot:3293895-Amphidinium_carterae.1
MQDWECSIWHHTATTANQRDKWLEWVTRISLLATMGVMGIVIVGTVEVGLYDFGQDCTRMRAATIVTLWRLNALDPDPQATSEFAFLHSTILLQHYVCTCIHCQFNPKELDMARLVHRLYNITMYQTYSQED